MSKIPDVQATLERNERYGRSLRGENDLRCGNSMAAFALEESNVLIRALSAAKTDRDGVIEECATRTWIEMMDICRSKGVSASKFPEWFQIIGTLRALKSVPVKQEMG